MRLLSEKDPAKPSWKDSDVDLVFECAGRFTRREDLEKHVQADGLQGDHLSVTIGSDFLWQDC